MPRVALFSDVDGTLLDASDRLALTPEQVADLAPQVDLILASSRTLVELAAIQRRLGLTAPMIAEHAAVVSYPAGWRGMRTTRRTVEILGEKAARLVPRIHECAADVGVRIVNQKRTLPDGGRSLRRSHSVCLLDWKGRDADVFIDCLTSAGLSASRSGTWITITSGPDKRIGVRAVLDRARKLGKPYQKVVAIGNAANDVPLLSAARHRFAVRNRDGHHPELRAIDRVHLLPSSGIRAWQEALDMILSTRRP